MNRAFLKFSLLILFAAAIFFSVKYISLERYLKEENLKIWIESSGVWGPAIYILIYAVTPTLMMPGLPMTVAAGILFGPLWGTVYASVGATLGAALAFLFARYMGRGWIEEMVKTNPRWQSLDMEAQRHGWKIVAFTRLIPLFPFNLLNYAFGLTRIRFVHYVVASFVFMLPATAAYVIFSSSLLDLLKGRVSKGFLIGLTLVIIISLLPILYRKRKGLS